MKGIVFNLLEDSVTESHGEDAWDELLEATDLDGSATIVQASAPSCMQPRCSRATVCP